MRRSSTPQSQHEFQQTLEDVLGGLGIVADDWELLIFGDGSGQSFFSEAGGCAAIFIDSLFGVRRCVTAGMQPSTVNRMELSAYLYALGVHHHTVLKGKHSLPKLPYQTHIFTDSATTANGGNRLSNRNTNLDLWALADYFEMVGYGLTWHHIPRNSNALNTLADELAGQSRMAVKAVAESIPDINALMPVVAVHEASPRHGTPVELIACETCGTPLRLDETCPICGDHI